MSEKQATELVRTIGPFSQAPTSDARPVFVKVSYVMRPGTGVQALSDHEAQIAFYYYWVDPQGAPTTEVLHGNIAARWSDGRWQIDDNMTKRMMPSWPALPSRQGR